MSPILIRLASWIAAFVIGAVYGVAGTIAHTVMASVIPVGLIVGAIACAALLIALRSLSHDRWAALAAGAGMIALVFVISQPGPGGSVIVEDTPLGNIWLYSLMAIVVLTVAWPDGERLRALTARSRASGYAPREGAE